MYMFLLKMVAAINVLIEKSNEISEKEKEEKEEKM